MHFKIDRTWPKAFVALLLACLLVQGTAVQTHVHLIGAGATVAALTGGDAKLAKAGKDHEAVDCLFCQQARLAGAYLLPRAVLLPAPPVIAMGIASASIRTFGLAATAHDWRSRAPPR